MSVLCLDMGSTHWLPHLDARREWFWVVRVWGFHSGVIDSFYLLL